MNYLPALMRQVTDTKVRKTPRPIRLACLGRPGGALPDCQVELGRGGGCCGSPPGEVPEWLAPHGCARILVQGCALDMQRNWCLSHVHGNLTWFQKLCPRPQGFVCNLLFYYLLPLCRWPHGCPESCCDVSCHCSLSHSLNPQSIEVFLLSPLSRGSLWQHGCFPLHRRLARALHADGGVCAAAAPGAGPFFAAGAALRDFAVAQLISHPTIAWVGCNRAWMTSSFLISLSPTSPSIPYLSSPETRWSALWIWLATHRAFDGRKGWSPWTSRDAPEEGSGLHEADDS